MLSLSIDEARRMAIAGQLLGGPPSDSLLGVIERLSRLQMDPTAAVARAERLVLWSRLGAYDVADLDRALHADHVLFEYWAYILPTSDFALHRETMRRYPRGDGARPRYVREWLAANAGFRRDVLRELRRRGPLRSRDLEDGAKVPWRTGGWNDGKNVGRLLDALWFGGEIAIVGRAGGQRVWDLAERRYPLAERRPPAAAVARRVLEGQLRARGVARLDRFGFAFDGRPPGWERALRRLVADGVAVPVDVAGLGGEWYAHTDAFDSPAPSRTTLLCPFDPLIADRERTAELFGFRYRLEMYLPAAKREYGYYVLPILHGDRLIGRLDPAYDGRARRLVLYSAHAEPDAPADAGEAVAAALRDLAEWLGASEIAVEGPTPRTWTAAIAAAI